MLSNTPKSSTPKQRQALVIAARKRGLDLAEIRRLVGGSITALSAAVASEWIEHFSGQALPAPRPQPRRRRTPGTVRMITPDHVQQIERLGHQYFHCESKFHHWLEKNFKVTEPQKLGTAERAGEVIAALKQMHHRRPHGEGRKANPTGRAARSPRKESL